MWNTSSSSDPGEFLRFLFSVTCVVRDTYLSDKPTPELLLTKLACMSADSSTFSSFTASLWKRAAEDDEDDEQAVPGTKQKRGAKTLRRARTGAAEPTRPPKRLQERLLVRD